MKHFMSVDQLEVNDIHEILDRAACFKHRKEKFPEDIVAANLFFEPSTRTKMSFVMAQRKLGIDMLDFQAETSSVLKGETLYDTAKTFESIGAQLLVIRHAADDWMEKLDGLQIPVINAGAGKTEHPTQCMLDLFTIYEEFGYFKGLKVTITGDILHSRVAHSNAKALERLGAEVYLCAPEGCKDTSLDFPYLDIDEAVEMTDILMLLRIQHERHDREQGTDDYLTNNGLTKKREAKMKKQAIIMHPAPVNRGVEIDSELVECERSRIFKQMENGVYVRMAIMDNVLTEWGIINDNTFHERQTLTAIR